MIDTSFPVHQATNDVGSDDSPDAVVALTETSFPQPSRLASAFGKGQAD